MAHVRLDNVLMPESHKLTFTPAAGNPQVLARAVSGDPLFALIERPEGKVVVLTVNLDLGDLPFRTAFPILAMNVLGFFTGQSELREALSTGATADVVLPPASTSEFVLRAPNGATRKLPAGGSKITLGPFDQCGVWAMMREGNETPIEQYAVNIMNRAESDLRPLDGVANSTKSAESGMAAGFIGRPAWWYLIGLAFLLAATEWYLYQRRWIS
jgi:hypothetical protein